jgi:hypothetical protein
LGLLRRRRGTIEPPLGRRGRPGRQRLYRRLAERPDSKFANDGEFLAIYGSSGGGEGQFQRPTGVAVDSEGFIYVADWGNERVQVLGADGSFRLLLQGQATVSKWAEDYFASNPEEMAERDISNLVPKLPAHLNTPYHVSSQTEPYFWGPVSVTLDREGRLDVAETNRHRFQVYQKR